MEIKNLKKVHFVGVSGIGVSAVAFLTLKRGIQVSGSSLNSNEVVNRLIGEGLRYFRGHKKDNVDSVDLVVRSAAVMDDNPEIIEAKKRGIPVLFYSEYLGYLMKEKIGIAIAGTHGKTTSTAMLSTIMYDSGEDPEIVCGGIIKRFGVNALYGNGKYFIAEACEYNRSFLDLPKKYGIITNIEPEHLDYYGSFENLMTAFREYMNKTYSDGFVVVNGDDVNILELVDKVTSVDIVTVGFNRNNNYIIENPEQCNGVYKYGMRGKEDDYIDIKLNIPGKFNIINSALVAAMALKLGIKREIIRSSLASFSGVSRRMEKLGMFKGNVVLTDYAHHPSEIIATIDAVKDYYIDREIVIIFQPHQYSRTLLFYDDFLNALSKADILILTEIYKQRDSDDLIKKVNSRMMYERIKSEKSNTYYLSDIAGIWELLDDLINLPNKYVILFMGAGDIDKYVREYFIKSD